MRLVGFVHADCHEQSCGGGHPDGGVQTHRVGDDAAQHRADGVAEVSPDAADPTARPRLTASAGVSLE